MNLLLIGMNHRTAPLALREHFAVEDVAPYLTKLVDGEVIAEAVLLSTCNRVEATSGRSAHTIASTRLQVERSTASAITSPSTSFVR